MRLRARHILTVLFAVLTAAVIYLAASGKQDMGSTPDSAGLAPPLQESLEDAPAIALDTSVLDLGVIPNDRNTVTPLRVHNRGGSILEVRDVASSCPMCTEGRFKPGEHRIGPGQSTEMEIIVKPSGIFGFHSTKTLSLLSNDPRTPRLQLTVKADIDPEFMLEPDVFDFGDVEKGQLAEAEVRFRTLMDTPLHVSNVTLTEDRDIKSDSGNITFTVEPIPEAAWKTPGKTEYTIRGTLSPEMPAGVFSVPIFVHTDLKRFSPYLTEARGTIHAPYSLTLDQEGATVILREQTPEAVITIDTEYPVTVTAPGNKQEIVQIQVEQHEPERWQVRLARTPGLERGIYEENVGLEIQGRDRLYKETIPVRVYSSPPKK